MCDSGLLHLSGIGKRRSDFVCEEMMRYGDVAFVSQSRACRQFLLLLSAFISLIHFMTLISNICPKSVVLNIEDHKVTS